MTPGIFIDCEQGSDVWAEARCGKVTASRAGDVIATTQRAGEAAPRRLYRGELLSEILTGKPYPQHVTKEMLWGIEQERYARDAYEAARNLMVDTCGFVLHGHIERFGASPDGLVGDDGMIQIKCPNTTTHLAWMLGKTIPLDHMPQMLAELACTGRKWCDFVSYDPRLPAHLQLFVCRMERNESFVMALEQEVIHFNAELDDVLRQLPQAPIAQPALQAGEEDLRVHLV